MTKEEFETIKSILSNQTAARYLVQDGVCKEYFNQLFYDDPDFHNDIIALRDKYLKKYTEQFEQIQITQ